MTEAADSAASLGSLVSLHPVLWWPVLALVAMVLAGAFWYAGRQLLRVALVGVLLLAFLRPGFGEQPARGAMTDLEVLVVLDRTVSMSAQDYDGRRSRLDGVRADLTALAGDLPGARFSLITWGRFARTELPFTADTAAFDSAVTSMRREGAFDGTGTVVSRPWAEMDRMLRRADREHPGRRRIVVLVSDGENTARQPQRSFAPLRRYVDGGFVLGYGTAAGGRMPVDDSASRSGTVNWIYDSTTGADARSRLNAANLRRIAGQLGIGYVHRTAPGGSNGMAELAASLHARPAGGGETAPARVDGTWMLALAAVLLGAVDLLRSSRRWALARWEVRR